MVLMVAVTTFYYKNELSKAKEEVEELSESTNKLNEINQKQMNEVKELSNQLDSKEEQISELESELESKTKKLIEVEDLSVNLKSQLEKSEAEKDALKSENQKLKQNKISHASQKVEVKPKAETKTETKSKDVNFKKKAKGSEGRGRTIDVEMTAYVAMCKEGCTGITATGVDVRNTTTYNGHRIIATDPSVIPLHSIVEVNLNGSTFTAISLDTGGAINGNIVDFLVGNEAEALKFGRQKAKITILK